MPEVMIRPVAVLHFIETKAKAPVPVLDLHYVVDRLFAPSLRLSLAAGLRFGLCCFRTGHAEAAIYPVHRVPRPPRRRCRGTAFMRAYPSASSARSSWCLR